MLKFVEDLLQGAPVEWKTLGEVSEISTGVSNRKDEVENGKYPLYVRSKNILRSDCYQFDETAIIIPGEGGIGEIFHYAVGKYALHQRAYRVHIHDEKLLDKFVFYYLVEHFKKYIVSISYNATVSSIRKPMLAEFLIPLPPLHVQEKIVEILDKFTELEAKLGTELVLRQKQYEYYRNKLLTFGEEVERKTIDAICSHIGSGGTPSTDVHEYYQGNIPWLRTQEVDWKDVHDTEIKITPEAVAHSSAKLIPANCVIVAMYGATAAKACINKIPLTTNQACCNLQVDKQKAIYKYVYYWLCREYRNLKALGEGSQSNLNAKKIKSYLIPLPPLSEQARIVSILDKFDTLTNSLTEGLPREIALRHKQYEYYRDALLTFPKAT